MSLLGAMNTAITGLNAQSSAFANIGDNVANSQTIGFKETDTRFEDYLTSSTQTENLSGSVVATPDYQNTLQGTVTQSSVPLAMAISGQGFFAVSQSTGTSNGQPVFAAQQQYTRAGDFQLDKDGYIVNGGGQYLNAWPVDASGNVDKTQLSPVQVGQSSYNPKATTQVTLSANLPATPSSATAPLTTQVPVYDALGTEHQVSLAWTPSGTSGSWNVQISDPSTGLTFGNATVNFSTGGSSPAAGLVSSITDGQGNTTAYAAGQPAALNFSANFGSGSQPITLNLGTFGQSNGLTQFAGTDLSVRGVNQDGAPTGSFTGVSTQSNGDIVANYSNGQNTVIARVPVVTFADPNALQRQNDQAFTTTTGSGAALAQDANSNGAGNLVTGSVESSNVDIAQEFSKLIIAQRAYSANTKLVTTADQMLQQTIDMKQ